MEDAKKEVTQTSGTAAAPKSLTAYEHFTVILLNLRYGEDYAKQCAACMTPQVAEQILDVLEIPKEKRPPMPRPVSAITPLQPH